MNNTYHLTQEHIGKGERRSPCTCPIALCLREQLGDGWVVSVLDVIDCWNNTDYKFQRARVPTKVADFINAFDRTGDGKPFSFTLEFTPMPQLKGQEP